MPALAQTSGETDREALVALFNATDGKSWDASGLWAGRGPLRGWPGVTTDEDGRVIGLNLSRNWLSGAIPPELGNLANLTTLIIRNNQLSGAIPPELGNLANLTSLDLSNNQLSGAIPPELDKTWSGLRLLGNQFTGCVSDYLRDILESDRNNSSPGLPACETSDPDDEETLVAMYYALGQPGWHKWLGREPMSEWSGVTLDREGRVVKLEIPLSGEIPPELGNLVNLTWLDLSNNRLSGCIPVTLRYLYNNFMNVRISIDGLPHC